MKIHRIAYCVLLIAIIAFMTNKQAQAWHQDLTIQIISPENKIYATDSIPLIFTINKAVLWIGYALDGQENVTISGNITLTNLADGEHDVVVYAKDICSKISVSNKVFFGVDTTPPDITDVSQIPDAENVFDEDIVEVNATVTDNFSGVKQVLLNYTIGNGTWIIVNMTNLQENVWSGTISGFEYCTWVNYTITAEDNVGNIITTLEVYGYQFRYHVIPEFSPILAFPMLAAAAMLTALFIRRKRSH